MKTPPHRIALIALALLLLAGAGIWWAFRSDMPKAVSTPSHAIAASEVATRGAAPAMPLADSVANKMSDPALAAALEQCGKAMMEQFRKRTGELAGRQDAKSQLAYALTTNMLQQEWSDDLSIEDAGRLLAQQQTTSQQAFARAKKLEPANPDIAWLAMDKCFDGQPCEEAQQALLTSEPDNAAAWLRAMTWAKFRHDDAAMEEAFWRAARASRYDTHRGSRMLAIMEGYADLPTPKVCDIPEVQELVRKQLPGGRPLNAGTLVEVMGMAQEQATVFSGANLQEFCKEKNGAKLPPDRQAGCVAISSLMAGDGSLLERQVAMPRLIELTGDTPAGAEWRERYRQLRWMVEQQRQLNTHIDFIDMMTNEAGAMEAAVRAAGRWPPPANWLPEDERSRSLIQTGRPPPTKTR